MEFLFRILFRVIRVFRGWVLRKPDHETHESHEKECEKGLRLI